MKGFAETSSSSRQTSRGFCFLNCTSDLSADPHTTNYLTLAPSDTAHAQPPLSSERGDLRTSLPSQRSIATPNKPAPLDTVTAGNRAVLYSTKLSGNADDSHLINHADRRLVPPAATTSIHRLEHLNAWNRS